MENEIQEEFIIRNAKGNLSNFDLEINSIENCFNKNYSCDYKIGIIPMYQHEVDNNQIINLNPNEILPELKKQFDILNINLHKNALLERLKRENIPVFLISPKLFYQDQFLEIYRKPPQYLINQELVSIQDGHSLVLCDSSNQRKYWLLTTSLFPPLLEGIKLAKNTYNSGGKSLVVSGFCPCFRNEAKNNIELGWREPIFIQSFYEHISLQDDPNFIFSSIAKIILLLESYGIPNENLRIRLNNFQGILLPILTNFLPFEEARRFARFNFDPVAAMHASKKITKPNIIDELLAKLSPSNSSKYELLKDILESKSYNFESFEKYAPELSVAVQSLNKLIDTLKVNFPKVTFLIDPLSVRLAYDDIAFQADILSKSKNESMIEVAGGGNYSTAAKLAWELNNQEAAPSKLKIFGTGIGNIRLISAIEKLKLGKNYVG